MTAEETITRNLERQGWQRQFVAAEPRLSEAVEMYKELGFQVHLVLLPTEENSSIQDNETKCRACFKGSEDRHRIIFTKPTEKTVQPCSD